jgi:hypothetical protein
MIGMALKTTNLMRIALYAMRAHAASQRVRFAFMRLPRFTKDTENYCQAWLPPLESFIDISIIDICARLSYRQGDAL